MSEQDRSEGVRRGSEGDQTSFKEVSNQFQTGSKPLSNTFQTDTLTSDIIKMGIAASVGFAAAWATTRDGIATGRRAFEITLENRAAIASNKLAMEQGFHGVKVSLGKSINESVRPIGITVASTAKAVAVLIEAQKRAEKTSLERLDRLETEVRDWQIRERVKP